MASMLERQLAASVAEAQQRKTEDIDSWLDLTPMPPKRLPRKKRMTSTAIVRTEPVSTIERLVIHGDLTQLNPEQRARYYIEVCESLGLNHLTQPFAYLRLNGKELLYAKRDCTDQLRKRDAVSVSIVGRERTDDLIIVTSRATLPNGRADEAIGAVSIAGLKGENLANALMKAETKAKRRATLSICGLGFLDETEVDSIPGASGGPVPLREVLREELHLSPHAGPEEDMNAAAKESGEFLDIMGTMGAADRYVFDPACTWESMSRWREIIGSKGAPSELGKRLSALYHGDAIAPSQRKEMGALWNRVDRKLTQLEGKLKAPPIESSFVDEPDGTEALGREREPDEDSDDD